MKNRMMKTLLTIAVGILMVSSVSLPQASAQRPGGGTAKFTFGAPLRSGVLFAYKYTERVKTWMLDKKGAAKDSSERILTYYITERQEEAEIGGGARVIEANIDSMTIDYRGAGGDIAFNTQIMEHANDPERVRHSAVFIPSTLVSSPARFTISPYGNFVRMESKSFESILEQAQDPMLDDFTYKRIQQMINGEYLSTVFLPWRNAVPFGHTLEYGEEKRIAFIGAMDRIVFVDSATVVLKHGEQGAGKPTLHFNAVLSKPTTEWVTFEGQENPILLKGADATITGLFNVDADGVVLSGLSTANGTAVGSARGQEVKARFEHSTYVELLYMTASPVN